MTQRIFKSLLVTAALAASASIAASPAMADIVVKKPSFGIHQPGIGVGPGGVDVHKPGIGIQGPRVGTQHRGAEVNQRGSFRSRSLKIDAARTCSYQLRTDAEAYGYKSVELIDSDIEQLGQTKFVVHGKAKLFDGYEYQVDEYECLVDHGELITTSELAPAKNHKTALGGGFFKFN